MVMLPTLIIPALGRFGHASGAKISAEFLCLPPSNRFRGATDNMRSSLFGDRVIDFIRLLCLSSVEVLIARRRPFRLSPVTTRIVIKEISYVAS